MSTPNAKAGIFPRRMLAGAAVAAITMSFALTAIVMANNLHQFEDDQNPNGISWDNQGFQGSDEECKDADLAAGEVLWHFIQNQVDAAIDSGQMTAEFANAGIIADVESDKNSGGVLHWNIITGHDTLLSASSNVTSDGNFNLSHICAGPEESVTESASAEQSVEGSVSESAEQSVEGSVAESEAASASGEQSVEAGTGTPAESQPDGALSLIGGGALPTIAFSLILLASLGTLAYANVKSVRSTR